MSISQSQTLPYKKLKFVYNPMLNLKKNDNNHMKNIVNLVCLFLLIFKVGSKNNFRRSRTDSLT